MDFFRDEVRNGFYIPTAIKQAWAAALEVLSEIDRICVKHNITYYADWGTLLGAVRHGGFVPWDDDLDICMKRDDYVKFRAVADAELPKNYVIHDYERKEDHWQFLARVVNNEHICFDEKYLREHNNFPWLVGVDIFLKDYLYPDREREECRDKEVMRLYTVAQMLIEKKVNDQTISVQLKEIEKRYKISLSMKHKNTDLAVALYRLAEQQMAKVKPYETDRIGQIFPWVLKSGLDVGEDKELYEKTIRLPFENTTIPVPAYYNQVLSRRYGNYCVVRKVWTGHNYPFFEGQRKDMEQLMDKPFPRFCFHKDMLNRPNKEYTGSLKTIARECVKSIKVMLSEAVNTIAAEEHDRFSQLLTDSQQLAIELGTLVETVKGEANPHTVNVVKALETFCEYVWQEYQDVSSGNGNTLIRTLKALEGVDIAVTNNIVNIKEILFLPIGPKEWNGFKCAYKNALKDKNTEVWVVPLPLLKKDYFGNVHMTDKEIEQAVEKDLYPKDITIKDWRVYDLSLHCPEMIYIQNPYDETNPCLTVPPDFYAKKMRKYTNEIIFIPFKKTGEFGSEDINDIYNMKHYAAAPGIIFSDRVKVQSENIREQYILCLTDFAGNDTRAHWEEKIETVEENACVDANDRTENKKLLFCIGANELMEHTDIFVASVKERIRIFSENKDHISVSVFFYPNNQIEWNQLNRELSGKIFSAVKISDLEVISMNPIDSDDTSQNYDAYYGSPSPLVPAFITQHKPVMLANYDM